MKNRRTFMVLTLPAAALAVPGLAGAQIITADSALAGIPATGAALAGRLPVDPDVRVDTLPNGLTYYIRENHEPENRAELRLVVDAGSVLETDAERGVAQFVEHMAFNGTAAFPKQALIDYLEGIGMRFGPDLNAYTSFDETVYMLEVPTDSAEMLETGIEILSEWAGEVTFEPAEVARERGVVIEEWRLGRGAESRMWDEQFPVLFHDSRYAERLPIGTRAVLDEVDRAALVEFYRRWYRPELMAVVAVGDFEPDRVARLIRAAFDDIAAVEDAATRSSFDVPPHDSTLVSIATDPEAANTWVSLYWKRPADVDSTVADYRETLVRRIFDTLLSRRLSERTQEADPPYIGAGGGSGGLVRGTGAYFLRAMVPEGGVVEGLRALVEEAERAARFGFTATELERAKADALRYARRAYDERENRASGIFAAEYARAFLEGEAIPGIAAEWALQQRLVPTITLDEVNARARAVMPDRNRVVLVRGPEQPGAVPTEAEIRAALAAVESAELEPYVDEVAEGPLVDEPPAPGRVVRESADSATGVVTWTLSNGARVLLKPTDFKDDQVLLRATSPGGASLIDDARHIDAVLATAAIGEMGLADMSRTRLDNALAGTAARVMPILGATEEVMTGSASPRDLETMLQLLYLHFTSPRADSAAFASLRTRVRASLENREQDPGSLFNDTVQVTLTQGHPRAAPINPEDLEAFDLDDALDIYRDRFQDADDFVFVLVGAFEPDSLRALVERWVASIPATPRTETWRDLGIDPPSGVIEKTVVAGLEPVARTSITFTGDVAWSDDAAFRIDALADVLRLRLR
ncbi:MAG: M16 family metallopeptidase, partial [Longimicrobiales bacterium]